MSIGAADVLPRFHTESPDLGEFCRELENSPYPSTLALLRGILSANARLEIKGFAAFSLAEGLKRRGNSEVAEEQQRRADLSEVEQLLEQVRAAPVPNDPEIAQLTERASAELDDLHTFGAGQPAREIEGEDIDGRPLKLSSYHGNVIVLVFWGSWCGPCMKRVPSERALVEANKGKRFTLLGVEADTDREKARSVMTKENMTWPSFWEGKIGGSIANGKPHFIAQLTRTANASLRDKSFYQLIENAKGGPTLDLPELSFHAWSDVPTLLVDAEGKRHAVVLYPFGEHPNIRDYVLGSDDEPTVIRQSVGIKGSVDSFQAFQGPGGRMIAIMEMNDTGDRGSGDTFVSVSRGHGWSTPINVTNNLGRRTFASKQTGCASNVAVAKSYYPGPAAATFDQDGNLLLVMINKEYGLFAQTALGVQVTGGFTSTPTLQFLHF